LQARNRYIEAREELRDIEWNWGCSEHNVRGAAAAACCRCTVPGRSCGAAARGCPQGRGCGVALCCICGAAVHVRGVAVVVCCAVAVAPPGWAQM